MPADPIFQLVFPQPAMLSQHDLHSMVSAVSQVGLSRVSLRDMAEKVRAKLNPHPAGQKEENVPILHDQEVSGTQHKYRETMLFFPTEVRANLFKVDKSSSLTVGSILSFFLYLLLPLGSVHLRRIGTTVPVQRGQGA